MPSFVYYQKKIMPIEEAKMGVMTHALHYGTAAFEGIRGNWNTGKKQMYLFRLKEHYERLLKGCRILKIDLGYSVDDLNRITIDVVKTCGFKEDVYVRPVAYKSSEAMGVRLHNLDSDFFVLRISLGQVPGCRQSQSNCFIMEISQRGSPC